MTVTSAIKMASEMTARGGAPRGPSRGALAEIHDVFPAPPRPRMKKGQGGAAGVRAFPGAATPKPPKGKARECARVRLTSFAPSTTAGHGLSLATKVEKTSHSQPGRCVQLPVRLRIGIESGTDSLVDRLLRIETWVAIRIARWSHPFDVQYSPEGTKVTNSPTGRHLGVSSLAPRSDRPKEGDAVGAGTRLHEEPCHRCGWTQPLMSVHRARFRPGPTYHWLCGDCVADLTMVTVSGPRRPASQPGIPDPASVTSESPSAAQTAKPRSSEANRPVRSGQ
jgi:hypothetical protein